MSCQPNCLPAGGAGGVGAVTVATEPVEPVVSTESVAAGVDVTVVGAVLEAEIEVDGGGRLDRVAGGGTDDLDPEPATKTMSATANATFKTTNPMNNPRLRIEFHQF